MPHRSEYGMDEIQGHVKVLGVALSVWRDRATQGIGTRRAATDAVESVDALLRGLHEMRARLVSEVRSYDDATDQRVDALLARLKAGEVAR